MAESHEARDHQVAQIIAQIHRAGFHEPTKVLALADRALHLNADHAMALRCKASALLATNKPQQALALLSKLQTDDDQRAAAFETAYCHYKLGAYAAAKATLLAAAPTPETLPTKSKHLLAQAMYNLQEYAPCAAIYEDLLAKEEWRDDQERQELITNLTAAYTTLDAARCSAVARMAAEPSMDLLYNTATAQVEGGNYGAALDLLQKAEALCRREHGVPAARDAAPELPALAAAMQPQHPPPASAESPAMLAFYDAAANIFVQRAYVSFVKGDEAGAAAILQQVLARRPSSISTYAVASTNWAAIKRHSDFFDTYRKLRHAQSPAVEQKLTAKQRLLVRYNTALLLLETGKLSQCRATVDAMLREAPASDLAQLASAALMVKERGPAKAEEYLKSAAAAAAASAASPAPPAGGAASPTGQHPPYTQQLLVAQLWLQQGNLEAALGHLERIAPLEGRPPVVATLAEGYALAGNVAAAKRIVDAAVAAAPAGDAAKRRDALQFAAGFYLRKKMFADAARSFEALIALAPKGKTDLALVAGLASALMHADPAAAYGIAGAQLLTPADAQASKAFTADALEREALPRAALEARGYRRPVDAGAEGAAAVSEGEGARKRPRRRVPKNTAAPIDPERWIPVRFRTYIRDLPKKRQRELRRKRAEEHDARRRAKVREQAKADAEAAAAGAAAVAEESAEKL